MDLEDLKKTVEQHLRHVKAIYQTSKKIFDVVEKKDVDTLEFYTGNRERMVNILVELQKKIEKTIKENQMTVLRDNDEILISWKKKFIFFLKQIQDLDTQIINKLETLKKETSCRIAVNFKFKEHIKKYNLNDVKR